MWIDPKPADIDALYKEWIKVKDKCRYPKLIDDHFKEAHLNSIRANVDYTATIKFNRAANNLRVLIPRAASLTIEDVFSFSESSDRIGLFKKYSKHFDDATYWEELRNCYTSQDYEKVSFKTLKSLFLADRTEKQQLMNNDDHLSFRQLPHSFLIYRGTTTKEKEPNLGLSWTLNKNIAQQFADKKSILQRTKGIVLTEHIKKSDAIAYFNERQEEEIIYIKYP